MIMGNISEHKPRSVTVAGSPARFERAFWRSPNPEFGDPPARMFDARFDVAREQTKGAARQ